MGADDHGSEWGDRQTQANLLKKAKEPGSVAGEGACAPQNLGNLVGAVFIGFRGDWAS
jgi:hypothetical protein